ncbi:MAG: DUF3800 domain-containing protein [Gammaproteobacteria bacterium]
MKFYFDESGDFRLDDDGVQRVGIVAGITIPESAADEVFSKFDEFVATLAPTAFKKEEPKGNRLTLEERVRFVDMVADDPRIVVTPAMLDIASINRAKKDVRGDLVQRMRSLAEQCVHDTMRDEAHLLANQFKNLSYNQALRLGSVAYCMWRAFEQTIIVLSGEEYFDCWDEMRFEIDPVQVRPGSREEQVFKWTMLGWLQGWSQSHPILTIEEIHTKDHPLVKNYVRPDDHFDLGKIYRDNLHYPQSSESKGLQIADMAATIIHHAVNKLVIFENLRNYGVLLRNNLWAAKYALGLFCLAGPDAIDYKRYEGLTHAVAVAKANK